MRIMLVTTSFLVGGAENQVYLLAKEFRKRGHEVAIVSLTPPQAYVDELSQMGVTVASLDMSGRTTDWPALVRLYKLVRSWRPDVLHAHMFHAILLSRLVRSVTRVPLLVSTTHNFAPEARVKRFLYRATDAMGSFTTNVSTAGTIQYIESRAAPRERIRPFPNGIVVHAHDSDVRDAKRSELGLDDHFAWLAVGRFEAPKDYPTLLQAFDTLVKLGSESLLLIVGDGSMGNALRSQVADLPNLDTRIRFLGSRSDVHEIMLACDGYVMSSVSEGLPLVLLEACVAAMPIVATNVGGNSEIVHDGMNGFLVPSSDPSALAGAMRRLELIPPEERAKLGHAGRLHVEQNYEIGAVAEDWLAEFSSALAGHRDPAQGQRDH
ncbi:MAG: glycosyltransferase [Trueperaceae bacterium]|nr:glycosyltransferase [Trueperaceae bacterium]MCC6309878.1 glycosyltransferase [Trueperaceae bacterium]MCW5818325.1 glycosyltransferase [Trueperaceae bacterium]